MEPYDVALIQSPCQVVRNIGERNSRIGRNLKRIDELSNWITNRFGEMELAVTGEYSRNMRSTDDSREIARNIIKQHIEAGIVHKASDLSSSDQ